ncbi:MAG TPA: ATP-binding protein [Terracidiphilus sp.]|nr:ATP-binding protein [Terracidiphilus sp.]
MIIESVAFKDMAAELRTTRPFSGTNVDHLPGLDRIERVTAKSGAVLVTPGSPADHYWIVLKGDGRAERQEPDGSLTTVGTARTGEGFGETPLLTGRAQIPFLITATEDSVMARFTSEQFWALLACCPEARKIILADMAQRLQAYQVEALHREKLVSLGTLAAGLMHELHNPGSAAKRSASQLRENLLKLQQIGLRNASRPKTPQQLECMRALLEHSVNGCKLAAMSSLEQAEAEEHLGEWLNSTGVENAYTIAPALVSMGFNQEELICAREYFEADSFSDALNWLGALISSMSLVCAIEESISRISDLVMAVKKFAYDERSAARDLDIHDSLQSTLTILGHKLRLKQITIEKKFDAKPSIIRTRGFALSQVWTNLIDNAADASPGQGHIEVSTWTEPDWLAIAITDHGPGIPAEVLPRIFEAFFTTKPQGAGTGLGLEIVHRIVTQKFGGKIDVSSEPGNTRFTVRLPLHDPSPAKNAAT